MTELRERKPPLKETETPSIDGCENEKTLSKRRRNFQPRLFVAIAIIIILGLLTGPSKTERASKPLFGVSAQSTTDPLKLTEEELKAFDGTDTEKPIYLGINGIIFDVSSSPAFYGPGGHYHHFVGKDATRAWVTECWDEPEQFTWRMDDVEIMFMPKWLDEQLEKVGSGNLGDDDQDLQGMQQGQIAEMAKKVTERFGKVTKKEKEKRRKEDAEVANAKVKETLDHWVGFFEGNAKYKRVGEVIRDESRPAPPKPCAEAMKKRPLSSGKLESLAANIVGGKGADKPKAKGEMPDFVKQKLKEKEKKKENGKGDVRDEL